ncbi:Snf7-domain-containing protein [Sparassis latifolia]|uniref:Snf7-domain-containing protein n=1 Tax=Sparassis crispa TaxID=139825 RepID=A0A401GJ21_9APHY|nr:hypothetical protein SCP_0405560 [Sparassis crispa]GBE82176.1 hypothetical protein SCP_0405560 [Sparassis crispa]
MPAPSADRLSSLETYASASVPRLKSLYSDFTRQKNSNPTAYTSNVEWWRRTLEALVAKGWMSRQHAHPANPDRLILHAVGPSIAEEFRVEGVGKPLSLPTVIAELCSTKVYYSLPEFLTAPQSIYDAGSLPFRIASYMVGKPLWWALQQLNVVGSEDAVGGHASDAERWKKVKGDYVILSLLERAAVNVIQRQRNKSGVSLADSLYNTDSFREEFAGHALDGCVLSDLDLKVLAKYLERDKRVLAVQKEVIKFSNADGEQQPEITAIDSGVLELKIGVDKLKAQIDNIQARIDERSQQISSALRQKRKEVAMSHLRARKQWEDLLRKRLGSLETLQSTLIRVETSAGDIEIMKSYESSTATLRAILAHPSLQRDKIDETLDAMTSANIDARELDDAIRMGVDMVQPDADIDEAELEDELKALVKEAEGQKLATAAAERARQEEENRRALEARLVSSPLVAPSHTPDEPEADTSPSRGGELHAPVA